MLGKLRPRSVYDVLAALALFIALGGTAYAVAANSVGTAQLKDKAVTNPKLAANSIGTGKVFDNSLTGADINEASLGTVLGSLCRRRRRVQLQLHPTNLYQPRRRV